MLSYFQANKLAYCNPTDASRRHKTPESEANDVVTQSKSSSQSFRIFEFPLPQCNEQRAGWHLHIQWFVLMKVAAEPWRTPGFLTSGAEELHLGPVTWLHPWLWRETHYFPRLFAKIVSLLARWAETWELHGEWSLNNYPKPIK